MLTVEQLASMDFSTMSRQEKLDLLSSLAELSDRVSYNKIAHVYPEEGKYARSKYAKQLDFFKAGLKFRQRALMGGNRVGKTFGGTCEAVYHLTGVYPDWWEGRRFESPVNMWACGVKNGRVRDTLQEELLGGYGELGTGLLPKDLIVDVSTKPGVPKGILDVWVKHSSGYNSHLIFKSYEEGMDAYMGTAQDVIWFDEEPPEDIYLESLMRLATTDGILYCTFTPLHGFSNVVMKFLNDGMFPNREYMERVGRYVQRVEWDDIPHLSEATKAEYMAGILPHERESRLRGIPTVGEGKVYPVPESDFVIGPIELHPNWPRAYGLDVGWRVTAAVFGAYDPQTDIWYIYDEYYAEKESPGFHAGNLRKKSKKWIPGIIDPSAAGAGKQKDGYALLDSYRDEDLDLYLADNSVEIGIRSVYERLASGRLKVFGNCQNLIKEFRTYRYDQKGRIVKSNDHAMDAWRYLIMTGVDVAIVNPEVEKELNLGLGAPNSTLGLNRNPVTGY